MLTLSFRGSISILLRCLSKHWEKHKVRELSLSVPLAKETTGHSQCATGHSLCVARWFLSVQSSVQMSVLLAKYITHVAGYPRADKSRDVRSGTVMSRTTSCCSWRTSWTTCPRSVPRRRRGTTATPGA